MASTLTKMERSVTEFKKFLEENNNEYYQAYDILPGRDPIEGQICWQFRNITDNLYEVGGLEGMLADNSTATDGEILFLFNGILVELEKLSPLLKETFKKSGENPFYSNAITIQNLAAKTRSKLKEVIAAGEKDMEIGDSKVVTDGYNPVRTKKKLKEKETENIIELDNNKKESDESIQVQTKAERIIINKQGETIKETINYKDFDDFKFIPILEIFKRKLCSKPTFYKYLKKGDYYLYKFGNRSFVDRTEFLAAFHKVELNIKKR